MITCPATRKLLEPMTLPDSRNTPGSMAEYLTLSLLADSRDIDEDEAGADDITATPAAVAAANLPASASILSADFSSGSIHSFSFSCTASMISLFTSVILLSLSLLLF